jgi:5-(carboxyamino)imidazole ribonucleotide mutase
LIGEGGSHAIHVSVIHGSDSFYRGGRSRRRHTTLPVLAVPMESASLKRLDSQLSTVQMPGGIPVATFAIGKLGAINAALFAEAILAGKRPDLGRKLVEFRAEQSVKILQEKLT